MNDEKNAFLKQEENSRLESNPAITDIDLNAVVGGFSSTDHIDEHEKIIRVEPKGVTNFDRLIFQASKELEYKNHLDNGYRLFYSKPVTNGPQAK